MWDSPGRGRRKTLHLSVQWHKLESLCYKGQLGVLSISPIPQNVKDFIQQGCVNILSQIVDVTPTGFADGGSLRSTEMTPLRG